MENLEPQKLVEASILFRNLEPHETAAVIARLRPASYARDARILERGTWHGQLYIIASGQVSVDVGMHTNTPAEEDDEAHSYIVAHLGPGECFGEMSLITGEPPTATIRAEQETTLWSLSQTDFLTLIGACPTLSQNINTILTRRLARTNQQVHAQDAAERIWLALSGNFATPLQRSLIVHMAEALAERSRKRVLLLELCEAAQAVGPRFARHPEQLRPGLLECSRDRSLLQAHQAPTKTPGGVHFAALASIGHFEAAFAFEPGILTMLTDLAFQYDYLLLVTMEQTPPALLQAMAEHSDRAVAIIEATGSTPLAAVFPFSEKQRAVFISGVPGRPTVGLQDQYAGQVGMAVTRLLPANMPLLERSWEEQQALHASAPEAELTRAVDFVARWLAHQTVGIAFGGGGARGFAHLGVLEWLVHHSVPIDYIAACSSGIITPGMYLIGKSFAESEEIFLEIQRHIVHWRFPRTSIFSNRGLKHMLRKLCGDLRFEDLSTPFAMVAVDLATRAGVVLDRGPLWQAGLASVALPGIFPPVLIGEHILMDAGMYDPVPIRLVRQMGADILLASELGGQEPPALESATPWLDEAIQAQKPARSPHIIDLLLRTYDLAMATIGMHSIREADVVIRPKLHRISLRQFSEGRKFVAAGREAVEQALPALHKHLPWL